MSVCKTSQKHRKGNPPVCLSKTVKQRLVARKRGLSYTDTPLFFMHSPVKKKYAAKAAHGARGEQGKVFPARYYDGGSSRELPDGWFPSLSGPYFVLVIRYTSVYA